MMNDGPNASETPFTSCQAPLRYNAISEAIKGTTPIGTTKISATYFNLGRRYTPTVPTD